MPARNLLSERPPRCLKLRQGNFLVFTAVLMVVMAAMMAFSIDVGYLYVARSQLQNAADSAAMAAAWELLDETRLQGEELLLAVRAAARARAVEYAGRNIVCASSPDVDLNVTNDTEGDVVFGRWSSLSGMFTAGSLASQNAVLVRVRRSVDRNGEIPLHFARVLGFDSSSVSAEAVAMFRDGVTGFRPSPAKPFTSLMPFALHIDDWQALLAGQGPDEWSFDTLDQSIDAGPDGVLELRLYPATQQGRGNSPEIAPGNFGTIDIGSSGNSTADLVRQIREGVSAEDLEYHGGELKLDDETGTLTLNGETGLSAGMADALEDIVGQPRTIALYSEVAGQGGDTVNYTIVGFAGIRILDYRLSGNEKYIKIQPAIVIDDTAIAGGPENSSYTVFQPVVLVR